MFEVGAKRFKVLDGEPVFEDGKPVFIPAFEGDVKIAEMADACLHLFATRPRNILSLAMFPK